MRSFPGTPCLGERVGALADGSLPDDVRDRSLAHVAACEDCRHALDVERLVVERLRQLPAPAPSDALLGRLLALGDPGEPMAPRPGHVPGTARQPTVSVVGAPAGRPHAPTRPTRSTRPAGRQGRRPSRRSLAVAAAGMIGAGVFAVTSFGGALPTPVAPVAPPAASLVVQRPATGGVTNEPALMRVLSPAPTSGPTAVPQVRTVSVKR